MRKHKTWEYLLNDGETEYKLRGRHSSNLDMIAAIREASIPPKEAEGLDGPALALLMFTRYNDITIKVFFERCIESHTFGEKGDIDINDIEPKEQTDILELINEPWIKEGTEAKTPEGEGQATAESFPDGVPEDADESGGSVEEAAE